MPMLKPQKPSQNSNIVTHSVYSQYLDREVTVDLYIPKGMSDLHLNQVLLINDGQDLRTMQFESILQQLYDDVAIKPLLCVGIHCGVDRKNEYGTAHMLNYKSQGTKAAMYTHFVLEELLPFIKKQIGKEKTIGFSFCGFSLGGLSALDIVWNHPALFTKVGIFSGSLWWRSLSHDAPGFCEEEHMIMQKQIRQGKYHPKLRFFFEAGQLDETADRNANGVIDSIDDTLSTIEALRSIGYCKKSIHYLEMKEGKHDVSTWAKAFPTFLKWGWGQSTHL